MSPDTTSYPVLPVNATSLQSTEVSVSTPGESTSSMVQDSTNVHRSTIATDSDTIPPPTGHLPDPPMPAAADRRAGMPTVEDALDGAKEAMTAVSNLSDTWEGALSRLKWVMDTVSPVAEVRCNFLSTNP